MNRACVPSARVLAAALWLVTISPLVSAAQQPCVSGIGVPGRAAGSAVREFPAAAVAAVISALTQTAGTIVTAAQLAAAAVGNVAEQPPLIAVPAAQQPSLAVVGIYWQRALTSAPASAPAFDATHAFVALRDGVLVAVSVELGSIEWSVMQQTTVGLTAAAGRVIGACDAEVWARDSATGQLQWKVTPATKVAVGPAVIADSVIVATDAGEIVALALSDGTTRWRVQLDATVSAPLTVGGDTVFVGMPDGRVLALAAATGDRVWMRVLRGRITALTAIEKRVLAGSDNNYLYVLESGNGRVRWMWRTGGDIIGTASADAKYFYYVSMDTVLRAHNRKNGHLAWKAGLPTRPTAGPALFGNLVAVGGVTAQVSIYAIEGGIAAPVVAIPSGIVNQPHLVPAAGASLDRLVLVTRLGEILAIGRSPEPALVPLVKLPGTELPTETLVPPLEQPLVSLTELLGTRYAEVAPFARLRTLAFRAWARWLGTTYEVVAPALEAEPPIVPLNILLGSQIPPFKVPPGVEPPLVPLGELPGRLLPAETMPVLEARRPPAVPTSR